MQQTALFQQHHEHEIPEQIYNDYVRGNKDLGYWSEWFGDTSGLASRFESLFADPDAYFPSNALRDGSGNDILSKNESQTVSAEKETKGNSKREHADPYRRPSGHRKGVREKVWESSKNENGDVIDPVTQRIIDPNEPWDMGHKPGYEFRKHQLSARKREISRKQFLDEYNNPDQYRPELPKSNRGHKGEAGPDIYYGP